MSRVWMFRSFTGAAVITAALSGCADPNIATPEPLDLAIETPPQKAPSAQAIELAKYYARQQERRLALGLLRTDGGGVDTPFDMDDIIETFQSIAFVDEYGGPTFSNAPSGAEIPLSKWNAPIRVEFLTEASVTPSMKEKDKIFVEAYVDRLAQLTKHPIAVVPANGNFTVHLFGHDDRNRLARDIQKRVPAIPQSALDLVSDLPRNVHCLVMSFAQQNRPNVTTQAVAVIRAEHPDLMRQACYHEEIAQGLGLGNDSPEARPSIFNDDDEFAYLTTLDAVMLEILYDPRLRAGMTRDQALPILKDIGQQLNTPSL